MKRTLFGIAFCGQLLLFLSPAAEAGQFGYPPKFDGAQVETYKTVGETKLNLHIFRPAAATNAPAIVFFFGGGWSSGSPGQFEFQCRHFASRGMVAITADYRVATRHQAKPTQCLADARSALRWVRAHASELGVDAKRIAAGGGSAGGHLAAASAFISEFDEPGEDKKISADPAALVLFNPALMLAPLGDIQSERFGNRVPEKRLGTKPEKLSPVHHVKAGGPPTIVFHGRADTTVPFMTTETFVKRMKEVGNRCELFAYDDQQHGFFNREPWRTKTLMEADKFLTSLGWLPAPPAARQNP